MGATKLCSDLEFRIKNSIASHGLSGPQDLSRRLGVHRSRINRALVRLLEANQIYRVDRGEHGVHGSYDVTRPVNEMRLHMLQPNPGPRRDDCRFTSECLRQFLRGYPDASGCHCPDWCERYAPIPRHAEVAMANCFADNPALDVMTGSGGDGGAEANDCDASHDGDV